MRLLRDAGRGGRLARAAAPLLAFCLLAAGGAAQDRSPRAEPPDKPLQLEEEMEVKLNYVDVEVFDKHGMPVTNLKKDQLRLFEGGVEQEITEFIPVSRIIKEEGRIDGKRRKPTITAPSVEEKRPPSSIVLLFDTYNPDNLHLARARKAAKKLVASRSRHGDRFAVVRFYGSAEYLQDFTSNEALISAALDKLGPSMTTMPVGGDLDGRFMMPPEPGQRYPEHLQDLLPDEDFQLPQQQEYDILNFIDSLRAIGQSLEFLDGRKTILFMSPGFEGSTTFTTSVFLKVLKELKDRNVTCHALDITGLSSSVQEDRTDRRNFLFTMAHETGGNFIYNIGDPFAGLVQLYTKINNYYLVGWYSSVRYRDGRAVPIRVELAGRKDLIVRAPTEIRAPKDFEYLTELERKDSLVKALAAGTGGSAIPVKIYPEIVPMFPAHRAAVIYRFPVLMEPGHGARRSFDCMVRLIDKSGRPLAERFTIVEAVPSWGNRVKTVTVTQEVPAAADVDHLQVVVRNNFIGETGTAELPWVLRSAGQDLFCSPPLLYGLDLTTWSHEQNSLKPGAQLFEGILPGLVPLIDGRVPTGRSGFVSFFVSRGQNPAELDRDLRMGYEFRKDREPINVAVTVKKWANPVSGKESFVCEIPADTLAPGLYALTVRALDGSTNRLVERTVDFRIPAAAGLSGRPSP